MCICSLSDCFIRSPFLLICFRSKCLFKRVIVEEHVPRIQTRPVRFGSCYSSSPYNDTLLSVILNSAPRSLLFFCFPLYSTIWYLFQPTQCPSRSVSATATPTAYYSPSLGGSNPNPNSINNNAGSRQKYDFRILKINYIKEVIPLLPGGPTAPINTAATTITTTTSAANGSVQSSEAATAASDDNITNNKYSTVLPVVGYVQLDKIQLREQQAIREAKLRLHVLV